MLPFGGVCAAMDNCTSEGASLSLQLTGPLALGLAMEYARVSKSLPQVHDVAGTCCIAGPCCIICRVPVAIGRCSQHRFGTACAG